MKLASTFTGSMDYYIEQAKDNLINDEDINKLENLYKDLDPKIGEPLRPILAQIREADKAKKEKDDVEEDEKKLLELEKKVGKCFENHKKALLNYFSKNKKPNEINKATPGKLNDDRFGDMGKRTDDDNRPLPGKLKNPFDGQENKDDDKNRITPGKLKNPFDGQGNKDDDKNRITPGKLKKRFDEHKSGEDKNKNYKGRKVGEKGEDNDKDDDKKNISGKKKDKNDLNKEGDIDQEDDIQDKNKLLTYLSLATEPEAFKNVFADAKPEICSFFNNLNKAYKPVIDKILNDKENKIKDLANKNIAGKNEKGDNPIILEPLNLNSLPEKEKYDEGVVLSLAKLYNYILDQAGKDAEGENTRIPGKLSDDRFGDMGKRTDEDNRPLPGKLKNPFDGQDNIDDDKKRNIPGKLKNPFDGQGKKDDDKNRKIPAISVQIILNI